MTRPLNDHTKIVVSIYSETWSPADVEAGDASLHDTEVDKGTYSPEQLQTLAADHGIDEASASDPNGGPNVWFTSSTPRHDRAHFEKGMNTHFSLHIHSINGVAPTAIGIQRIANLIEVKFGRPLEIPAMPIAIVAPSDDSGLVAILDAAPWLAQASITDISNLIDEDFEGAETADDIYYTALEQKNEAALAIAKHLMSDGNSDVGFSVVLDGDEVMRWLEENRPVMHAYLEKDPEHPAFGYYINLDERGEFYADVRDMSGNTVFEIHAGGEDEENIFTDGFMGDKNDLTGLKSYLVDLDILKRDDLLLETAAFEKLLESRKDDSPCPEFG